MLIIFIIDVSNFNDNTYIAYRKKYGKNFKNIHTYKKTQLLYSKRTHKKVRDLLIY
jgi:hypothetical protein